MSIPYCISFIGFIISSIILNVLIGVVVKDAKKKTNLKGAMHALLLVWWLAGYLLNCDQTYGPTITMARTTTGY